MGKGSDDEGEDEELDPRVEGALGELNTATDDINKSEKDLEAAKKAFKLAMQQVQIDLQALVTKIGKKNIEKARPYHQALYNARKAHFEARRAAQQYEQASGSQKKSKTEVGRLEKELMKGGSFNPNLQQQLNQATQSVMEADKRKRRAAEIHSKTTQNFLQADEELMNFAKSRKKIILKTQPYFSSKEKHDKILLNLKEDLMRHEAGVKSAKARVAGALNQLEKISLEIHENRKRKKEEAGTEAGGDEAGPAAAETVSAAIAEAQAAAVEREKAELERLAQEEAERKAEEEAAAAAEAAEAAAEAAAAEGVESPDAATTAAEDGASVASEAAEDDETSALDESVDFSEEDLRLMIEKKLNEDDMGAVLDSEAGGDDGAVDGGGGPAEGDFADDAATAESPTPVDEDAINPITV